MDGFEVEGCFSDLVNSSGLKNGLFPLLYGTIAINLCVVTVRISCISLSSTDLKEFHLIIFQFV